MVDDEPTPDYRHRTIRSTRAGSDRVVVIGAGIAGLCAAYYLCRAGAKVTVLEARRAGSGASSGNAGWVTPAQAGPLPEPGLLSYGLRSLIDRDSALYFQPAQLGRMLPWLLRFASRCNEADYARGRVALGRLGRQSVELLDAMAADGVEFERKRVPMLVAAEEVEHARAFLARLRPLASLGFAAPRELLERHQVRSLEPTLSDAVRAGVLIDEHCVVDPRALIAALRARLPELGVELHEATELRDVDVDRSRVVALHTSSGIRACDRVVLAPGAWLASVARLFGIPLPVQAGKGYSFELRPSPMPRHPLLLLEPHVGCSPLDERLRIAGTMEFSGVNGRLDRRRIDSIVRGASRMLDTWGEIDEDSVWCGLRPIAPDGLPIIDRHPRLANVFVAGAYSMLGMTLAAPAARSLATLVLTGKRPAELEPFRATRFRAAGALRRTASSWPDVPASA